MKIAICSQGEGLSSCLDTRFGRCRYLVLVDTESDEVESVPNPALASAQGAGVASVQYLSSKGVQAVLAQKVGPNAYSALQAAGISVWMAGGDSAGAAIGTTVGEALEEFKKGRLPSYQETGTGR